MVYVPCPDTSTDFLFSALHDCGLETESIQSGKQKTRRSHEVLADFLAGHNCPVVQDFIYRNVQATLARHLLSVSGEETDVPLQAVQNANPRHDLAVEAAR